MIQANKKRIAIIATGGTIAMVPPATASLHGQGAVPNLSADDLVRAVPELAEVADVTTHDFARIGSANLTLDVLSSLTLFLQRLADDVDGIVITQGTDSMEESAFYLDLCLGVDCPVAVTGAMQHPGGPDGLVSDGPKNLLDAVDYAASDISPKKRVVIVMNGEVHDAAYVLKGHTSALDAFHAPRRAPLGLMSADGPVIAASPTVKTRFSAPRGAHPRVMIFTPAIGMTTDDLRRTASDCDGLVIAAFGGGHMPEAMVEALQLLAAQMPVLLGSRAGAGEVLSDTYGYPGAERDLLSRGLIHGGALHPLKLRLLLILLLADGADEREIAAAIRQYSSK